MKCSLYTALVLLASLSYLRGQAVLSDGDRPKLAFEVASVRVNKEGITGHRTEAYIPNHWKIDRNPLLFRAIDTTLQMLVFRAFDVQPYQLIGQPDWLDRNAYDVEAQSALPSVDQQMQMLQVLLAERFQLKVHFEDRLKDVYFLTVGRSGLKARATEEADGPGVRPRFGSWFVGTAETFAKSLSLEISSPYYVRSGSEGLPVIDRTGLTGFYDFGLRYPDDIPEQSEIWERLCGVLENQLGLQLKKGKAQIRMLVIDHVDAKPSEN